VLVALVLVVFALLLAGLGGLAVLGALVATALVFRSPDGSFLRYPWL
jgi:hypothetical protein